ncbi:ABC transporter ATP-binding protein [Chengkuizengella axinellae]|uniref:ATP-binding cassette domain-containing protein n=1 Tax=Chengkuizengella axinellae TaxID=3064388 RepID=A0ABT9J031_9BACL|nr:ABC transporter ATP-binding protein [Chengkuizengella sp. 2205SS18-9]MDP5274984.1 ATP-binding cassette domain-containing protein [Chengkuizengella sp. 2205SS18-9]
MSHIANVENLRLKFAGSSSLLFKDVSSSFFEGEKVLILGPSGCGKSTLLQVLSGLIPHAIEVPIKADHITTPESWGYVFQDPDTQFCMPYVDEEIAFVLENLQTPRSEMQDKIQQYLDLVHLELDDIHTLIHTLSGGMKQRLAIASVMALQPDVLFLDEPTAMLDPESTKQIWDTIKEVARDKTVVVVEHKIDHVLDFIERIILFNEEGEIIADGSKDYIMTTYKQQLMDQGIWYPGVWKDYIKKEQKTTPIVPNKDHELISVSEFTGYRGKFPKIEIEDTTVFPGEWIAIIGENGAGKSTLLHSLMQLIKTTGDYKVDGRSVDKVKKLTNDLAFVFQNPEFQFVTNSVYDEIAYSLQIDKLDQQTIDEKVTTFLNEFRLKEQKEQHPYQLSMGQKRRLSVAAAIIKEQKIVLLDEPTFGQDAKNTFKILELIEHWRKQGTSVFMVTHSMEIVKYFSTRVWLIEEGKLTFDGKAEQLFKEI